MLDPDCAVTCEGWRRTRLHEDPSGPRGSRRIGPTLDRRWTDGTDAGQTERTPIGSRLLVFLAMGMSLDTHGRHGGQSFSLVRRHARWRLKAVSQLRWPGKAREEWFSLGENHERACRFGLHQLRNRFRWQLFLKFDIFGSFCGFVAQRGRAKGFFFMEKGTLVSGTKPTLASGTKEKPRPYGASGGASEGLRGLAKVD